jgi:hypothetical protein
MIPRRVEVYRRKLDKWTCVCLAIEEEGIVLLCAANDLEIALKIAQTRSTQYEVPWGIVDKTGHYRDMVDLGVLEAQRIVRKFGLGDCPVDE